MHFNVLVIVNSFPSDFYIFFILELLLQVFFPQPFYMTLINFHPGTYVKIILKISVQLLVFFN